MVSDQFLRLAETVRAGVSAGGPSLAVTTYPVSGIPHAEVTAKMLGLAPAVARLLADRLAGGDAE